MMSGCAILCTPISFTESYAFVEGDSLKNKKILVVAPHPDDDAIGCGALLFYLSNRDVFSKNIHIACAVTGFNGVSDNFLKRENLFTGDVLQDRKNKSFIRENETKNFCEFINATPVFWRLPFYEERKKDYSEKDSSIVTSSIEALDPDVIILINEVSDPHGTHALVRNVVIESLKHIRFKGTVFGYRVWEKPDSISKNDMILGFDRDFMKNKEKGISFYESQLVDPKYPCQYKDFIELAKRNNLIAAMEGDTFQNFDTGFEYLEHYKFLIL